MALTSQQVEQFEKEGYLIAEDLLAEEDLQPVIDELNNWVDHRARTLFAEGKITDLCDSEPFETRLAQLFSQYKEFQNNLDLEFRGPGMFEFLHNERILDAVECLIGPEITCHPVHLVRAKCPAKLIAEPGLGDYSYQTVTWHQDAIVFLEEADLTPFITCWFPLVDATVENGCMKVLPKVASRGLLQHYWEKDTDGKPDVHFDIDQFPDLKPVDLPCPKGGAVFLSKYAPHTATPNHTDGVRWSVDLRYQPSEMPTGVPYFPEFVARSNAEPQSVFTDYDGWVRMWDEATRAIEGKEFRRIHDHVQVR